MHELLNLSTSLTSAGVAAGAPGLLLYKRSKLIRGVTGESGAKVSHLAGCSKDFNKTNPIMFQLLIF